MKHIGIDIHCTPKSGIPLNSLNDPYTTSNNKLRRQPRRRDLSYRDVEVLSCRGAEMDGDGCGWIPSRSLYQRVGVLNG